MQLLLAINEESHPSPMTAAKRRASEFPVEVLEVIILYAISETGSHARKPNLWTVTWVCMRWRRILISTLQSWDTVQLTWHAAAAL